MLVFGTGIKQFAWGTQALSRASHCFIQTSLVVCAEHDPAAHKRGILGCESMRALLCCSTESHFCKSIDSFTQNAGYRARRLPGLDPVGMSAHLARPRSRDPAAGTKSSGRKVITLVLPFVQQIAHLSLQGL